MYRSSLRTGGHTSPRPRLLSTKAISDAFPLVSPDSVLAFTADLIRAYFLGLSQQGWADEAG